MHLQPSCGPDQHSTPDQRPAPGASQAIGGYGAEALLAAAAARGRGAGGQLRVLTHCNTGSLATAGFGTALGVIRALHA